MPNGKAEFFKLIEATLDRRSVLRIRYAYRMAKDIHRNQRRKAVVEGEDPRYFEHPREVALISMRHSLDVDLIIACLLHDTIEDGGGDPRDADEIELFLGADVIRTIRGVSKVPKDGFHERFAAYSDWRARWVKACDRLHNLRTLPPGDAAFRQKQITETMTKYQPLFEEMVTMVPDTYKKGARAIVDGIYHAMTMP